MRMNAKKFKVFLMLCIFNATPLMAKTGQQIKLKPGIPSQISLSQAPSYLSERRSNAKNVLTRIYWPQNSSQHFSGASFLQLFGRPPREFQTLVYDLAKTIDGPSLTIIEAPMGIGKTEAALSLLCSPYAQKGRGFYFALPTQATSNQMYQRIKKFLATSSPD